MRAAWPLAPRLHIPWPPLRRGFFHGCSRASMKFVSLWRPRSKDQRKHGLPLDPMGWASLAAGLLVASISFFTSYSHVDLFGILQFKVNQQIGIPLLLAAMAALIGEDEVFSVGVVKLASNHRRADQRAREREANEADRERHRAARERNQTARRYPIQARCLIAQCRFLLADSPRNRLQLNEALPRTDVENCGGLWLIRQRCPPAQS